MASEQKWLKVARADSKGKILDLTDPEPLPTLYDMDEEGVRTPKFLINYRRYDTETHKSEKEHKHWIDAAALRVLTYDLATGYVGHQTERGYTPLIQEFKGGPAVKAGVEELGPNGIVSRSLSVAFNDQLRIGPVFQFKFELREGVGGEKGQVMPVKDGKVFLQEFINLPVALARQFGSTVRDYLTAKDTIGMLRYYG